jgi:hypothetical protein
LIGGPGSLCLNNLFYNCVGSITILAQPVATNVTIASLTGNALPLFTNAFSDDNVLPNGSNGFVLDIYPNWGTTSAAGYVATNITGLATWQGLSGNFDAHSTTNPVTLNALWQMTPASSDAAMGTNLSAIFNTDFYGHQRPTTGPWDPGAVMAAVSNVWRLAN